LAADPPLTRMPSAWGGDPIQLAPGVAGLDLVDALSPGIEGDVAWRRCLRLLSECQNVGGGSLAEPTKLGLDLIAHRLRQSPAQVGFQNGVIVELIAEFWCFVAEIGHGDFKLLSMRIAAMLERFSGVELK
jgi:hypothetical protein